MKADLEFHARNTLFLQQQKAASYPSLALWCIYITRTLSNQFRDNTYKYGNQFSVVRTSKRGPPAQTDSCVVLIGSTVPRFLYECKPQLSPNVEQLSSKHIIEVLLQGYYCVKHYKVSKMFVCLTDLADWHYMRIELKDSKIAITGYKHIAGINKKKISTTSLTLHTQFIVGMESSMCQ